MFQDIPDYPINPKTAQKKQPKTITVLKKEGGGGPVRYDHDHRFNGFFLPLPLAQTVTISKHQWVNATDDDFFYLVQFDS